MAFKRRGRASWYFKARTVSGWVSLSTGAPATGAGKGLAGRTETMWEELARAHRAWDVLEPVLRGERTIGDLYDAWEAAKHAIEPLRSRLTDTKAEPLIKTWEAHYRGLVKPDSANHAVAHVRWLLPAEDPRRCASLTSAWLSERLDAYPGKRNTRRKVHSSWSMFCGWLVTQGKIAANPMDRVTRPKVEESPIAFYELATVERIVAWQPTPERAAVFALLYGTGIEVSVALQLTRDDVWEQTREIRAAGTKAYTRDRVARVASWAWERVWAHVEGIAPGERLWPCDWSRWTVSDWHRQTVGAGVKAKTGEVDRAGLHLAKRIKLHAARDHWAVRAARVGTPIALIQSQLGHESPMLTLDKYGKFIPSGHDRAAWEAKAAAYDQGLGVGEEPAGETESEASS